MRIFIFLISLFSFYSILPAQEIDPELLKGMKMRSIGPAGMSGRVTAIDVDLSNPDRIFIGAASGGVWKSESGGVDWEPIFDKQPVQSIGALKINQNNPSEIWVGTGEGNPRNSHNSGEGIYKSIDGGKTWKLMGLEKTKTIHRILISNQDPNTVYVGAMGSIWGPNEERGVFKTTDGGETWRKILYTNNETGVADMVLDPTNPNKLLVAMWEYGRKPWTFNSGGAGSALHLTYDGGKTWKKISNKEGLPKGELGRIGLAIAPSKPNIIYALVEAKKNGLYKSTDGGEKWSLVSEKNIGNRPFYYSELYVDPSNENRIFNLWSYVSKSEDGGKTFETIMDYGNNVHPDHHAFWIHPTNTNYMINGNDGGLNISRDGAKTWRFIENLPLAQFYHINHDMSIPYRVGGGMQDNGSWVGPGYSWKRGGIVNSDWQEVLFGDGFDVVFDKNNDRYGYGMSQGGWVNYIDFETGDTKMIRPIHPDGERLRFNWNAAIALNPFEKCGVYFGSQFVHKSADCGSSWEIISPDLTTNDTTKQKQHISGGLTVDATQAENHTTISCIAPSPVDADVIYVGTDDGKLQVTKDGGNNWSNTSSSMSGLPKGSYFPQIEVSKSKAGEAFAVANNYRRNDFAPYVYHTTNYGATWNRIVDGNKVNGYCHTIVQDPVVNDLLFLGTDRGLFYSLNGGRKWTQWKHNYPSVPTIDLKIHPREHDLIIGTFGRAAYVLDDIRPLRALATDNNIANSKFKILNEADGYLASWKSYSGVRFVAQANFSGKNKSANPGVAVWKAKTEKPNTAVEENGGRKKKKKKAEVEMHVNPDKKKEDAKGEKEDKKKKKELVIKVVDSKNDTIRTYKSKLKNEGINIVRWNMRRDGAHYPSSSAPKDDKELPSGVSVVPGKYKLIMSYGEETDSTFITVHKDPRSNVKDSDLQARYDAYVDFYKVYENATSASLKLVEAKKTTELVDAQMVNVVDSVKTEIKELSKVMNDSLKVFTELYFPPKDFKGIDGVTKRLTSHLWGTTSYLEDIVDKPHDSAVIAVNTAKQEINKVIDRINHFFENDWKDYRERVESVEYSLFKEYERVERN